MEYVTISRKAKSQAPKLVKIAKRSIDVKVFDEFRAQVPAGVDYYGIREGKTLVAALAIKGLDMRVMQSIKPGYGSLMVKLLLEKFGKKLRGSDAVSGARGFWYKMGFNVDRGDPIGHARNGINIKYVGTKKSAKDRFDADLEYFKKMEEKTKGKKGMGAMIREGMARQGIDVMEYARKLRKI